jgi:hypothetical protein
MLLFVVSFYLKPSKTPIAEQAVQAQQVKKETKVTTVDISYKDAGLKITNMAYRVCMHIKSISPSQQTSAGINIEQVGGVLSLKCVWSSDLSSVKGVKIIFVPDTDNMTITKALSDGEQLAYQFHYFDINGDGVPDDFVVGQNIMMIYALLEVSMPMVFGTK